MQTCPPRSLPQALGGGPAGGARLRVSDAPAFDIRSVTAGVRRVHHRVPRFGFWLRETRTFRRRLFFGSESDLHRLVDVSSFECDVGSDSQGLGSVARPYRTPA